MRIAGKVRPVIVGTTGSLFGKEKNIKEASAK